MSKKTIREIKLPLLLEGPYVMASVATKIFQEVVEGVFYIHNMGIVHRDLKVSGEAESLKAAVISYQGGRGIGSLN